MSDLSDLEHDFENVLPRQNAGTDGRKKYKSKEERNAAWQARRRLAWKLMTPEKKRVRQGRAKR